MIVAMVISRQAIGLAGRHTKRDPYKQSSKQCFRAESRGPELYYAQQLWRHRNHRLMTAAITLMLIVERRFAPPYYVLPFYI